jgi:hypothetical protein
MENRLGHDFSRVRVHVDSRAAHSAEAVAAHAYTVGSHVVFGSGRYSPGSDHGDRLLAHELTHVIQQGVNHPGVEAAHPSGGIEMGPEDGPLEREADAAAAGVAGPVNTAASPAGNGILRRAPIRDMQDRLRMGYPLPYREATELVECIRIMGEENAAYCRQEVLGEEPEAAPAAAQPPFQHCDPNRPLTWADFTGSPSGGTSAFTAYDFNRVTTPSGDRIRAAFAPGRSFVVPQFGNPTDSNLNGCAANISQCETFFPPGSTGGSFALNSTPSTTCPAAERADPAVVAGSRSDCAGIIATECQRVAQAESDRLLRHEQLHLDIACVLAEKANAALAAGGTFATVHAALLNRDSQVTGQYDTQTQRGCLAAQQATWETNVANGLPAITIP